MSRLTELIARIDQKDPELARELLSQVKTLMDRREFGLNFERHVPESVQLPGRRIRRGDKVRWLPDRSHPHETVDQRLWLVTRVRTVDGVRLASLLEADAAGEPDTTTRPVEDLIVMASFRDPIYPGLRSTGRLAEGGDKPFHAVINAENFHALEALRFAYEGSVDAIYIDPPYNTRDKDWKYDNDYVDSDDAYKHSKWLAMMERRLKLAKKLLSPKDSVLIVTIDEKEYLRLGMLLEQTFRGCNIQMVSSVINRKGVPRRREFSRVDEYIFFVYLGEAGPALHSHDMLTDPRPSDDDKVTWVGLRRRGSEWRRQDRPGSFYPIFVNTKSGQIVDLGAPLALGVDRSTVRDRRGCLTVWPLNKSGAESRWQLAPDNVRDLLTQGFLRSTLQRNGTGVTIEYLSEGQRAQIEQGTITITGRDKNGAVIARHLGARLQQAKTQWNLDSHGATAYGTQLVTALLPGRAFPYPKSLYAVEDALRFFMSDKPDAVVLDFFAGSGTTTHAVMRLNRQDGGRRQSISVTNNEVSAAEAASLRSQGHRPGDPEWEALGICSHITKPRVTAAVTGLTPEGQPLVGEYKFIDESAMAEGFAENVEFFDLTYEDVHEVRHNLAFGAIAPMLWMRAGSRGRRIDKVASDFDIADTYGVLFNIDAAAAFIKHLKKVDGIACAFIVTDSESQYQLVADALPDDIEPVRLYEAYLRSVGINNGED